GGLTEADQIKMATEGRGTDFASFKAVFAGKSKARCQAIMEEFKTKYGSEAYLSVWGMLRHPFRAAAGGGHEGESAEDLMKTVIGSEHLDKRQAAELQILLDGDPKALFDPRKPPAGTPQERREAAKLRGQAEIDAMNT